MKRLAIVLVLLLAACERTEIIKEPQIPDQCLRRELFNECMKSLPAGPVATQYNDWDDVVAECRKYAWSVSTRLESMIKKECRG